MTSRRLMMGKGRRPSAGVTFAGVGDVVGSALGYWGLRAYTLASIGANVIRLHRTSDDAMQTFTAQADGSLDASAITTFRDAAGAATLTVDVLYDQSGNGHHLDHYAFVNQGHWNNQPSFVPTGGGSVHPVRMNGFDGTHLLAIAGFGSMPTQSQPYTGIYYAKRTGNFTNFNFVFGDGGPQFGFGDAVNKAACYVSGFMYANATDSAWHAIQGQINGASSDIIVDGTSNPVTGGSDSLGSAGNLQVGTRSGNNFTGDLTEFGLWAGSFSSPNKTTMNANMIGWWGS